MKVAVISDTHNNHDALIPLLPAADVLVHCGDMTNGGTERELEEFNRWLKLLRYKTKIVIGGNHDSILEDKATATKILDQAILLQDELLILEGKRIYGTPWMPPVPSFHAFQQGPVDLERTFEKIPEELDLLITHVPPANCGGLDGGLGSIRLRNRINIARPKTHVFGHCHHSHGIYIGQGIRFVNAASVSLEGMRPPIVLEI